MNKAKARRKGRHTSKRSVQRRRTFGNIQKRRKKHADAHGLKVEDLGAKRWTQAPK